MAVNERRGVHFNGPLKNKVQSKNNRAWFSDIPMSRGPELCEYNNDFIAASDYAAANWVITTVELGVGAASVALAADEKHGAVLLTNDVNAGDLISMQMTEETFTCSPGARLWYEARVKVDSAVLSTALIGLNITDTTPLATSDNIGFKLTSGSAVLSAITNAASSATTTVLSSSLAADTYARLGFMWDGVNSVSFYVNRSLVATHTTNIPATTRTLTPTLYIENGSAASRKMTVDYIYVAQER